MFGKNAKTGTKKSQKKEPIAKKLDRHKFNILGICCLSMSVVMTFLGIYIYTGNPIVAGLGCVLVQGGSFICWETLLKPELNDGKRKPYIPLTILGTGLIVVSIFFTTLCIESRNSGELTNNLVNHHSFVVKGGKEVLSEVKDLRIKEISTEIDSIQEKTNEIEKQIATAKKQFVRKQLQSELGNLIDEKNELKTQKESISKITIPEDLSRENLEKSGETSKYLNQIKVLVEEALASSKNTIKPEWNEKLTYQPLREENVETKTASRLKEGNLGTWGRLFLAIIIDVSSILFLFCKRRVDKTENSIVLAQEWSKNFFQTLFRRKRDIDLDIQHKSGVTELVTLTSKTLKEAVKTKKPIVIEVDGVKNNNQLNNGVQNVNYSTNGHSMGVGK